MPVWVTFTVKRIQFSWKQTHTHSLEYSTLWLISLFTRIRYILIIAFVCLTVSYDRLTVSRPVSQSVFLSVYLSVCLSVLSYCSQTVLCCVVLLKSNVNVFVLYGGLRSCYEMAMLAFLLCSANSAVVSFLYSCNKSQPKRILFVTVKVFKIFIRNFQKLKFISLSLRNWVKYFIFKFTAISIFILK